MKIGIIGLGKMGEALVSGIRRNPPEAGIEIRATTRSKESAEEASSRLSVKCSTDNKAVAAWADVLLVCVKPHQMEKVLKEMSEHLRAEQLLISIAASITNQQLASWSSGPKVIRAMPNTPALIGQGMTALAPGAGAGANEVRLANLLFSAVGRTATVEESLMDGVTGLSGCGPAYGYLIIEALSEAGVKVGLKRETATLLAAQTLLGAAQMVLERGDHPAALKDEVTTPAGCTIDGLMALEEGKLRVTLIKAVLAAERRSKKLRE